MNVVLLGGNGYLGREFCTQWLQRDSSEDLRFFNISKSGKNPILDSRVENITLDICDYEGLRQALPATIECVINFIGAPAQSKEELERINKIPVEIMLQIASEYKVKHLGFVGGILGPKDFVAIKRELLTLLKQSTKSLAYIEPTLLYGAGRNDTFSKFVPLLKILGIFSSNFKPMRVETAASDLLEQVLAHIKAGKNGDW